jgi:hypothetical protein
VVVAVGLIASVALVEQAQLDELPAGCPDLQVFDQ